MIIQVPATLEKVMSLRNRAVRLTFESQENLTDLQLATYMAAVEHYGWLNFHEETPMDDSMVLNLPDIPTREEDGGKSPAQRMRAVLFRWWEQLGKQGDFETFYRTKTDKIIDSIKEKLT
jgi:hypothetical protein